MEKTFDCVIRGGTVADGTGAGLIEADVGIIGSRIAAVGPGLASGREEVDARGLLVTPGFVDVHTHYDGQVTWEHTLAPSSDHGVTTVVMGNCGVGFAPCRPADRESLITLMEGVEDLPEAVLATGLPWAWEDFGSYLDFLESRNYNIDIAAQVPHAPVRVFAMGERAFDLQPATEADSALMAGIVGDAIRAGALGFTTSRSLNHKGSDGRTTPSWRAAEQELIAIARAVGECGTGVLQAISDFQDPEAEMEILGKMCRAGGRPMSVSLMQRHSAPEMWRDVLRWIEELNDEGCIMRAQVAGRPVGALMGLQLSFNPMTRSPAYAAVADLPLKERARALAEPSLRARIIADLELLPEAFHFDGLYPLGNPPDYEPTPDRFISAMARERGVKPVELLYDLMLEEDGAAIIAHPVSNFADKSLDTCRIMMEHPLTIMGLGDGGAHLGLLCDASQPTHMLNYWARDRARDRLPLERVVASMTTETASAMGLGDRGQIAPGMRADVNVIDFDHLAMDPPSVTYDLPEGGRRVRQRAHGYVATFVAGEAILRHDEDTGARPGRLVRGAR
ncbi:MAG TPA: amidohydrolase family protein [Novosphingobium sp.]|nr:amidohydrolase family protein [Novosphingobium sp.]